MIKPTDVFKLGLDAKLLSPIKGEKMTLTEFKELIKDELEEREKQKIKQ